MFPTPPNKLASTSLVLSLAGWFLYFAQWCFDVSLGLLLALVTAGTGGICSGVLDVLPLLIWVSGIVCGHIALRQIHAGGGGGRGRAVAGLVLGYLGLFFMIILIVLIVILITVGIGAGWLEKFLPHHGTGVGILP